MTKTNLLNGLNSFISAVGRITKTRHTSANSSLVDELYSDVILQDTTLTEILSPLTSDINYKILISKNGNNVNINGYIRNEGSAIDGGFELFDIVDTEYRQRVPLDSLAVVLGVTQIPSVILVFKLNNKIALGNIGLGFNETICFNFNYKTNL